MSAEPQQLPEVWRRMPTDVRNTLSWLAHLLDAALPLRTPEDDDEFAHRHLGVAAGGLVAVREVLGPFTAPLVARALGADLKSGSPTDIAGLYSDESPRWDRLVLDDTAESVPSALVASFAAGSLAEAPLVVSIDTRYSSKTVVVHARTTDANAAERYLHDLVQRGRGECNYLRGRCVEVGTDDDGELTVRVLPTPATGRADVVLPPAVWEEVDVNVAAIRGRRELLSELSLGTNRGLMLVGPPGTGKSALCRVLAAELAGTVTVVLCTASAIADHLTTVYDEVRHLAPALVLLEDLDLLVGTRGGGSDNRLHSFLAALDGAMSRHRDVLTVATTNDVKALDAAATRAARFDRIVEVPLPDEAQRAAILRRYLGRLGSDVDATVIAGATTGASGADLRELVRRCVLEHGEEITTAALLQVVRGGAWAPTEIGLYL